MDSWRGRVDRRNGIIRAQYSVTQYAENAGLAAAQETRGFVRFFDETGGACNQGYHYKCAPLLRPARVTRTRRVGSVTPHRAGWRRARVPQLQRRVLLLCGDRRRPGDGLAARRHVDAAVHQLDQPGRARRAGGGGGASAGSVCGGRMKESSCMPVMASKRFNGCVDWRRETRRTLS
eukprot:6596350-Prymnesium_polylepis.2